jgi:hypothetical protein
MTDPFNETSAESIWRKWWIRVALVTTVVLLSILCAISQPGLTRFAGGDLFPQFPTPTAAATWPPSIVLHNRTLHLPVLAVGNPCPVTAPHEIDDGTVVMGVGPVYLVAKETAVYCAPAQSQNSHGWGAGRLIFAIHSSLHGLVLVRGRQLDGAHEIRFGQGEIPSMELLFALQRIAASTWTRTQ